MTSKILISSDVCTDDVICYLASRYRCTPKEIIRRFLEQERFVKNPQNDNQSTVTLEENEMEILRDMNINPSVIEFI